VVPKKNYKVKNLNIGLDESHNSDLNKEEMSENKANKQ
jgi:hypothetical protein